MTGTSETITRDRMCEAVALLGLNPTTITHLNLTPERVTVTAFVLDDDGNRTIDHTRCGADGHQCNGHATRTVTIPVVT